MSLEDKTSDDWYEKYAGAAEPRKNYISISRLICEIRRQYEKAEGSVRIGNPRIIQHLKGGRLKKRMEQCRKGRGYKIPEGSDLDKELRAEIWNYLVLIASTKKNDKQEKEPPMDYALRFFQERSCFYMTEQHISDLFGNKPITKRSLERRYANGDFMFVPAPLVSRYLGGNYVINELQTKGQQLGRMASTASRFYESGTGEGFLLFNVRKVFNMLNKQEELEELEKKVNHESKNLPGN
jgi:hypothetical protein